MSSSLSFSFLFSFFPPYFPCSVFSVLFHSSLLCVCWTKLNVNLSAFLSLSHRVFFTLFHSMVCVLINTYLNYLHAHTKQKINRRQAGRRSVSRLCVRLLSVCLSGSKYFVSHSLFEMKSICGPPIFCEKLCVRHQKNTHTHKFTGSKTVPENTKQMTTERNKKSEHSHTYTEIDMCTI